MRGTAGKAIPAMGDTRRHAGEFIVNGTMLSGSL